MQYWDWRISCSGFGFLSSTNGKTWNIKITNVYFVTNKSDLLVLAFKLKAA